MSEFKIKYISIKGFWGEYVCRSEFNNDICLLYTSDAADE